MEKAALIQKVEGTVSIPIYVLGSPCLQGFPFFFYLLSSKSILYGNASKCQFTYRYFYR